MLLLLLSLSSYLINQASSRSRPVKVVVLIKVTVKHVSYNMRRQFVSKARIRYLQTLFEHLYLNTRVKEKMAHQNSLVLAN
jgi:hypothetical protein